MKVTAIIRFKHSPLYNARKELNYTLQEMADAIGIAKPTLWNWENFRSYPRTNGRGCRHRVRKAVEVLCSITGLSYSELFPKEFKDAVNTKRGRKIEIEFRTKQLPEWTERNLLLPDPEELYIKKERFESIKPFFAQLPEQYQRVLVLRYGLEDNRERTLEEIAQILSLTRERIRQIEARALRIIKIRHLTAEREWKRSISTKNS